MKKEKKYNVNSRLINLIFRFIEWAKIDWNVFYERYAWYLAGKQMVNQHLLTSEIENRNFFIQCIPDRYSLNLRLYNKSSDFFSYADLKKWIEGNYLNNVSDIARFFFLNQCMDQLIEEKIEGDVAELGVFRGNSASLLAKFAQKIDRTCYLFDTFEGFDARDLNGQDQNVLKTGFSNTSLQGVKELVGEKNTSYVKGFFPESLNQVAGLSQLALVHLDCDLEAPFKAALEYFYPRLQKGGFLIMHDYSSLCWPGATKAIDRFFSDKPEFVIPIPDKSGTCVIRKVS